MKKIVFISLILCFLIGYDSESSAFWGKRKEKPENLSEDKEVIPAKETETKQPVVEESKKAVKQVEPEKEIKEDAKRSLAEKKRKQLDNTEWEIELNILSSKDKDKKQKDIITFSNNQVVSAYFLRSGFPATNYTLTVQDDGVLVWETMQTSENSGIAFWRGEIDANVEKIKGILSHHIDDKTIHDYSFFSINKKAVASSVEGKH